MLVEIFCLINTSTCCFPEEVDDLKSCKSQPGNRIRKSSVMLPGIGVSLLLLAPNLAQTILNN
jgi:hypothetical protein